MKNAIFIVVSLAVGLAVGYVVRGLCEPAPTVLTADVPRAKKGLIADRGDTSSLEALRRRVAELEKALAAAKGASVAETREEPKEQPAVETRPERPRRGSFREEMQRLAKEDPARFAQMTNRFARMQNHRRARAASRQDYLAGIDVSSLGPEARETHARLQAGIAKREALEAKMHDENLTDEERHAYMREMHDLNREMREVNQAERANLLNLLATEMGCSDKEASALVGSVSDIIEATNDHGGGMPPPSGDAPPGPPPGAEVANP